MSRAPAPVEPGPSPIEPATARVRGTFQTAFIWLGTAALFWLAWQLAGALLVIFAGLVAAAGFQAATDGLKRVWTASHGVRLTVVVLAVVALFVAFVAFAGVSLSDQAAALSETLRAQAAELGKLAQDYGIKVPDGDVVGAVKSALGGQVGRIPALVGSIVGGLGTFLLIVTLGIYFAAEPRLYERGVEWLAPEASRPHVASTIAVMATMLKRWLVGRLATMAIEGVFIFVGLWIVGVPLAGLLGLVAGLLAFIPTLGAAIAGVLIVAVGFSAGTSEGLWAIGIYFAVQLVEGNILNPLIEKKAVDLAPAVVLGAQLLFGVLFGIIGVALADPIMALVKVALQRRSDAVGAS